MILHTAARILVRGGERGQLPYARFHRIPVGQDAIFFSTEQLRNTEDSEVYKWACGPPPGRLLRWTTLEHYIYGFNPELSGQVIFIRNAICSEVACLIVWASAAWRVLYVPVWLFKNANSIMYIREWPRSHRVRVVTDDRLVTCKCRTDGAEETIIRRS